MRVQQSLFGDGWCQIDDVEALLDASHYLGPGHRGVCYRDHAGALILGRPTSRRLPSAWMELARWCITDRRANAGSMQWARVAKALRRDFKDLTTIVSYSDPSVGHTGALYRACNWWWAPTWHRLRPPPTGNGSWDGRTSEAVKDRWIFPLREDPERESLLRISDRACISRYPWSLYREPGGASYKAFLDAIARATIREEVTP